MVDFVDDIGTVFVNWDNGSRLGVVYGEDVIKRIPKITETLVSQIMKIRATGRVNMLSCNEVQRLAFEMDLYELVDFLETDSKAYSRFIMTGERD